MFGRALLILCLTVLLVGSARAEPPATPKKYALLVGCTEYPNHTALSGLRGPPNDVKMWNHTLTKNFGFPEANIIKLVGWDEKDEASRPTLKNIQSAFEKLIATAEPGTHIVIALSGHGLRVPLPPNANPLDPNNFEPDGLDEVFLPADVGPADKDGQIPNALKDDDVGRYLDRLRAKGAHVLIVFDCCHSGTMTRGGPKEGPEGPRVVSRVASPNAVGITEKQVADSVERAKKAVAEEEKRTGKPVTEAATVKPAANKTGGSLVAFYAAQPFEEAPEMPLPEDKPIKREYFHGLLTFTLNSTLQQRQAPLTYADLAQIMASQYRGIVGVKGPVPYAEGDLDREVLGYNVWPKSSDITLTKGRDELTVSAGELRGVTRGSILSIHPPANDPRDPNTILGYLKVVDTTVASATVEPTAFAGKEAVKPEAIPDLARCKLAARDYGDMRVKLFVQDHAGLKAAFKVLANDEDGKEVLAMLRLMEKETEADWVLRVVSPKQAADEFGLKQVTEDMVFLIRAAGREVAAADVKAADKLLRETGKPTPRRLYSDYVLSAAATNPNAAADLAGFFKRDLPKIFRWQNLWRVAGDTAGTQGNSYGVKLEVTRHATKNATGPGEPIRGVLPNKSFVDITITNTGAQNLWVVPLYLDSQLEISIYGKVIAVEAGKTAKLVRGQINYKPGQLGTEGLVVFLLPQSVFPDSPNFKFLEQTPLRVASRGSRGEDKKEAPKTPFGELLKTSVLAPGTRGPTPVVETTPGVISGSWVVVP